MNNQQNYPTQGLSAAVPSASPKSFEIISKINNKITNLSQALSPVLVSRPTKEQGDKAINSGLIAELENIDSRIGGILDCLEI